MENPVQHEMSLPPIFWSTLSQEDKNEFFKLRASFHHGQKISSKDRRIVTFRKELLIVRNFLERSEENLEARCILTGVCFAGPIVCVNTRQLKSFLDRCKSSINGSFQQLGYVALRTKSKARSCILSALPSLQNQQTILRQWTVRVASEESDFCFVTSFSHIPLPEILDEDLFPEKKGTAVHPKQSPLSQSSNSERSDSLLFNDSSPETPSYHIPLSQPSRNPFDNSNPAPLRPRTIQFELPVSNDYDTPDDEPDFSTISTSYSLMSFQDESTWNQNFVDDTFLPPPTTVRRSQSAITFSTTPPDWDLIDIF